MGGYGGKSETRTGCMIAASNESGIVQPWEKVAKLCQERNVLFHCDTTQWVGKLPLSDLHHCSSFTASAQVWRS